MSSDAMSSPKDSTGLGASPAAALSPVRWWVLALVALAIAGHYYEYDAVAPLVEKLRAERDFSHTDIGTLNAVLSLPNIVFALVAGWAIDRFTATRMAVWSAAAGFLGAVLTAGGPDFVVVAIGRMIFGLAEEGLFMALLAILAQWFPKAGIGIAVTLFLSLARVGSYSADTSPQWAAGLYARGVEYPLWLGAGITGFSLLAILVYWWVDRQAGNHKVLAAAPTHERIVWADLFSFNRSYWYILGLHVLYASVFFPFRSTFAIGYFENVKGLSNEAASINNSWVFFTAVFATPFFGFLADRYGRRASMMLFGTLLMTATLLVLTLTDWPLWLSTAMMGVSFAVVPGVIWPSTTMLVEQRRLGTALGLITVIQNVALTAANLGAGKLLDVYGAGKENPGGYLPMMVFFFIISLAALWSVVALWRREQGPDALGLESIRTKT